MYSICLCDYVSSSSCGGGWSTRTPQVQLIWPPLKWEHAAGIHAQDTTPLHDHMVHRAHQQPYCMQLWSSCEAGPGLSMMMRRRRNLHPPSTLNPMPVTDVAYLPLCSDTYNTHLQACRQAGAGDLHTFERAARTSVLRCSTPACVLCKIQSHLNACRQAGAGVLLVPVGHGAGGHAGHPQHC